MFRKYLVTPLLAASALALTVSPAYAGKEDRARAAIAAAEAKLQTAETMGSGAELPREMADARAALATAQEHFRADRNAPAISVAIRAQSLADAMIGEMQHRKDSAVADAQRMRDQDVASAQQQAVAAQGQAANAQNQAADANARAAAAERSAASSAADAQAARVAAQTPREVETTVTTQQPAARVTTTPRKTVRRTTTTTRRTVEAPSTTTTTTVKQAVN